MFSNRSFWRVLFGATVLGAAAYADDVPYANLVDVSLEAPAGFRLVQQAENDGTRFVIFESTDGIFAMYARPQQTAAMKTVFAVGATVVAEREEQLGPLKWQLLETTAKAKDKPSNTYAVFSFRAEHRGVTYEGYARSKDKSKAEAIARQILGDAMISLNGRSLSDEGFDGKKYYLGWGAVGGGDPSNMQNEVKYDVAHTHDIFTKKVGGDYESTTLIANQATASSVRNQWSMLKSQITPKDMYVQYSSGHGMQTGLGIGVSYNEMRDAALAMSAKEIVVFTMACFSGGLVNAFNAKKTSWQDFPSRGRTLFVMSSSSASQESSTGPGTDPGEPGGPEGSAGSAFGHALWKALIGEADGFLDGVKDGYLSLEEIRDYAVWRTKQIGGHTPQFTGSYSGALVMNATPPPSYLASLTGGTEHMTDAQIADAVRRLDREFRVKRNGN